MSEPDTTEDPVELSPEQTESDGEWLAEQVRLLDLEDGFAA
jgi:hypothetical protein